MFLIIYTHRLRCKLFLTHLTLQAARKLENILNIVLTPALAGLLALPPGLYRFPGTESRQKTVLQTKKFFTNLKQCADFFKVVRYYAPPATSRHLNLHLLQDFT